MRFELLNSLKLFVAALAATTLLFSTSNLMAKGSDIRFRATVVRVDQTSATEATVTVKLQSFDVGILVNADTEIESHGDEVGLEGLTAGAFVKIAGFFSDAGIVAEEIDILDTVDGQFRLRGTISAAGPVSGGTLITLLGVDVVVNEDTAISRRGPDEGVTAGDLAAGMVADVHGIFDDPQLVATRLKVGNRESEGIVVEFEGTISAIDGSTLQVDTEAGGSAAVVVTDSTRVKGDLEVGKFVELKGTLNEALAVVATIVNVDDDGDGDADDDNPDKEEGEPRKARRGIRLLAAEGSSLEGQVETEFLETVGGPVIQELEIAFHNADRTQEFQVRVEFASGEIVDFGTVRANGGGRVKVKFRTNGGRIDVSLNSLLPGDETVQEIVRVEILDGEGNVVLSGTF